MISLANLKMSSVTFLNCMTRFIRLLVVALVDDDDVEVYTRSSMEILFFTAW